MTPPDSKLPTLRLLGGLHLDGVEGEPGANAAQVKRLALLAYLACTAAAPPTRERLCALFWPELDADAARHSLRQSLYALRQMVGGDAVVSRGQFVTVDLARLDCDAAVFEQLVGDHRFTEALARYGGDLLDGVHVFGAAPEFDTWLEGARQRLRDLAVDAAIRAADAQAASGDLAGAERHLRFAEGLHPLDEALTRRRMTLLAQLGNRGAALDAFAQLAARLRAQLEVDPSDATRALVRDLSMGAANTQVREVPRVEPRTLGEAKAAHETDATIDHPSSPDAPHPRRATRPAWAGRAMAAVGVAVLALLGWQLRVRTPARDAGARGATALVARGAQAYCRGDLEGAMSLVASAVALDSGSAEASYAQSVIAGAMGRGIERIDALRRAHRLASTGQTTDAQQLLIRAAWAEATNDRAWLAIAESLATRHPALGAAVAVHARALVWAGDFASARARLREATRRPDLDVAFPLCQREDLGSTAVTAAILVDSLDVAEREARARVAAAPASADAHYQLASILQRQDRPNEALQARQASIRSSSAAVIDDVPMRAEMALRDGRFAEAETLFAARVRDPRPEVHGDALWWTARLLRERGRARDAVATARTLREVATHDEGAPVGLGLAVMQAQALQEAGMTREAIALFDSLAHAPATGLERELPPDNGLTARRHAWDLAHIAAAVAESGDTLTLRALVDSVRATGAHSAFGRDQKLHHHLLGELLVARGDTAGAIRELQLSTYSPVEGYSRTSLLLGRLLTAQGRAVEAVGVLRAALRAPLDGSALFTTRTELLEALADALQGAGRTGEARTTYARVAEAWRYADPRYRTRARRAHERATATVASREPRWGTRAPGGVQ